MHAVVTVLPGDGIGPEVVRQGCRVLQHVGAQFGYTFALREALIGGAAIDLTGEPFPADTLHACQTADAVLLGAVGGPAWDHLPGAQRPEKGLLALRQKLQLFANLRPVKVHPVLLGASPLRAELLTGVDIMVVRELTGGIYFGDKRRMGDVAEDVCRYSVGEVTRVVQVAAKLAQERRGRLTSVDKANVLETSRLWRETTQAVVTQQFATLHLEHMLVDAAAMHLLRRPADFDVIVTENMFGDILTDEASMLAGSLGLLPSASLGAEHPGVFEPIHGSAPDIAGRGTANPYGTILSVALLLRHALHLEDAAAAVEAAVHKTLAAGVWTADLRPAGAAATTEHVGDAVLKALA